MNLFMGCSPSISNQRFFIQSAFGHLELASLVGSIYHLTVAVFLPTFASISDVFGRHVAIQLALAFFFLGSLISTASQSLEALIVGRGLAGIGIGGLLTVRFIPFLLFQIEIIDDIINVRCRG